MSILLMFVLFVASLVVFAMAYHFRRPRSDRIISRARSKADKIIAAGKVEADLEEINRCLEILTSTNAWLVSGAFQDDERIKKLRDIRDVQKRLIRQHANILQRSPLR